MSRFVKINGREYDIVGVQNNASGEAWADLIKHNGMNPFKMTAFFAEHEIEDETVGMKLLTGDLGGQFVDVFLSMVFLAMRTAGDRSPTDPGRLISPSEAFAATPLMPALAEFFRAGEELRKEREAQRPGGDPTRVVRTVSDPDGNRAARRAAAKKSKTSSST